ncbi:MAG TPA: DUF2158 domain-containing protein [Caulobacteraceae bacterium]|nr:DUF2158 domain-containing protein [Caulobacteraceae bacterium]
MRPERFKPGDIVRMRSGGPAMTVTTVDYVRDAPDVCCMWFEARGRPHFYHIKVDALDPAEPDAEPVAPGKTRR